MSNTARTDTKLKKGVPRKKTDETGGKLSPTHSEIESEKITFKVIDGEDIQCLAIKEDDLKKIKEYVKKPSKQLEDVEKKKEAILVKKANKNAYPTIEVKVAKLAPNKPLKPIDVSDSLGLRYDKYGNCVPHSILGNVEEYLQECIANGKSIELPYDTTDSDRPQANLYLKPINQQLKKEKLNKSLQGDYGENALQNWYSNMQLRKNIQKHISNKTERPVNSLLSNKSDNFLQNNETKTLIDRTLPLVEHGKGYRTGSEFWNQSQLIGDEETGIHMSLKKSERGLISPIELISRPNVILEETTFRDNQPIVQNYPWDKSKYLEKRLKTLKPFIKEQIPHFPKFDQLQIVGENPQKRLHRPIIDDINLNNNNNNNYDNSDFLINNTWINQNILENDKNQTNLLNINNPYYVNIEEDPAILSSHPDVIDSPIFGPCILFGGQTARWNGSSNENNGITALESRLNFETKAGKRVLATFEIINIGTTTIYYDWRKVADSNPFQIQNKKVQRFYFDTRSNVILPGDLLKLHIVFKSMKGGIFTEKWEFITHPSMLSGASLILTLRGVAIQEDKFKKRRISIERSLFIKEADLIARNMVDLILSGVRTPERPSSPLNAFMTEEDEFEMKNPNFHYDHDSVQEIKKLYSDLFMTTPSDADETSTILLEKSASEIPEWNLSIDEFKQLLMDLDEHDPKKQSLLASLNAQLANMSFTYDKPNDSKIYSICYNLLCLTIDEISTDLFNLKTNLLLPLGDEYYPNPDEFNKTYEDWKKEFEIFKQLEQEKKNRQEKEKGKEAGGKGGKGKDATGKGAKGENKKDDKAANSKKTPVLSASATNRSRMGVGGGRDTNNSRSGSRNQEKIEERVKTPIQLTEQQIAIKNFYMEKAYLNVYQTLSKTIDDMETIFDQNMKNVNLNDLLFGFIKQNSEQSNNVFIDYID